MREDQCKPVFCFFFSLITCSVKTLVVSDAVSVPVRTVKNHRMSLGRSQLRQTPLSVGSQKEGGALPHCHRSLFNASKQLAWNEQHTFASWTVTRSLLATLMADSRLAATQVGHAWFPWHAAQRAVKLLAGSDSSRAQQKHAFLLRAVWGVGLFALSHSHNLRIQPELFWPGISPLCRSVLGSVL